ncbi:MAG: type VI secretion system accessory protein TagJ [Cellvibrionaceae bacterium]
MSSLSAEEYFQQGKLDLAMSAAAEQVRDNPDDEQVRTFFVELLCVKGEYERADAQLNALMTLKPDLALAVATWRQLIHAAQIRSDVYQLKAKPEVIDTPTDSIKNALDILVALDEKDEDRISQLVENIDDDKKVSQFLVNNDGPALLRDLDDITANIFELLGTNGKYFWVDFSQVVEIEFSKPTRILDVLWRKANIVLTNGTEGEVYLPTTYPMLSDDDAALGKKTEWQQSFSLYQGIGLKTWLYGDNELTINEIDSLKNMAHSTDDAVKNEVAEG